MAGEVRAIQFNVLIFIWLYSPTDEFWQRIVQRDGRGNN